MPDRRQFLLCLAALALSPRAAFASEGGMTTAPRIRLAAAWQAGAVHQVGLLEIADTVRIQAALDVPTRAHGLLVEADGSVLAVARRPGNWLLRFTPSHSQGEALVSPSPLKGEGRGGGEASAQVQASHPHPHPHPNPSPVQGEGLITTQQWRWSDPQRAYTGHLLSDGKRVYTTETDLETGAGLIGVRDAKTLEKLAEWPTFGVDPHEMVWDATHPERIYVANGGIPTRPESGRIKLDLAHMDSSLVCLDTRTGAGLGLWQLDDSRLSLRHLDWQGNTLGIALQAEHDDPRAKAAAPVLALFDGKALRTVAAPRPLAGYAGSIVATAEGFAVSCPRAHGIARFSADGVWRGFIALEEACALATQACTLIAGGRRAAYMPGSTVLPLAGMRLDNHWVTPHP